MNNYRRMVAFPKMSRGIIGVPRSYMRLLNNQFFADHSKDLLSEDPQMLEPHIKRGYPTEHPRHFIKKSLTDNKQLRFHQCYFNPISCF